MRAILISSLIAVGLVACDTVSNPVAESSARPEGSVSVGNGVYMKPVGLDDTGCEQYTAWSNTSAVLAVIQYRRPDGSFTALRSEADCGP